MAGAGAIVAACHCGQARITLPRAPEQVTQCNCSLCTKTGFRGVYFASDELVIEGEFGRLRTVVEGPDGALYVLTNNRDGRGSPREGDDRVLRVVPPAG